MIHDWIIKNPNLAAGVSNGIDFTLDLGGDICSNIKCSNNNIDGGKYGIYQPNPDEASARTNEFRGNTSINSTTAPFFIYGKRRLNNEATGVSGPTVALAATHLSVTCGQDLLLLDSGAGNLAFIDDGSIGDVVTLYFVQARTIKQAVDQLNLNGTIDCAATAGSVMTFQCLQNFPTNGQNWTEVSRMIR